MTRFLVVPIYVVYGFVTWWLWQVPVRIFYMTRELLLDLDEALVFKETLRLWIAIEPLFGDYTWQGRIIGFLFRFVRILASIAIYVISAVLGLATIVAWWLLPIVAVSLIF